jgi:hypothetical protein
MFDQLKDRLRRAEAALAAMGEAQRDQLAMAQLAALFPGGVYLPITTWSMAPTTVVHLCNEAAVGGARTVVEFGSGYSTMCLAALKARGYPDLHICSVESDPHWMQRMEGWLTEWGLRQMVTLVYAPLENLPTQWAHKGIQTWYTTHAVLKAVESLPPVDLLVVDGPHGASAPFARYPAVPVLKDRLSANAVVYLDDANRPAEREIAAAWQSLLGGDRKDFPRYTRLSRGNAFDPTPYAYAVLP